MIKTSLTQLTEGLADLEMPKDGVYIIHSSLVKFGLLEGGLPGIMGVLRQTLGQQATILMPAFTFSYGQTRTWDCQQSKAETGALTEYFRKQPNVRRTLHPFHSLSVCGPHAEYFLACKNRSSFGPGSPFALLYDMDAINLAVGTEFEGGATFLHHVEEMAEVPYRFYKAFPGTVIDTEGTARQGDYKMFVRKIEPSYEYVNRWEHVWRHMVTDNLVRHKILKGANLFAMNIRNSHDWLLQKLIDTPYYCAKKIARK